MLEPMPNRACPNGALNDAELAEMRLKTARFKREIAQAAGGLVDAAAVQAKMGVSTEEAVYSAAAERRLLAVDDDGELRFPLCQFAQGQVLPGIQAILEVTPTTSGWRLLQYLFAQVDGLAGDRPIDLIQGSRSDLERAIRFARRLEQ